MSVRTAMVVALGLLGSCASTRCDRLDETVPLSHKETVATLVAEIRAHVQADGTLSSATIQRLQYLLRHNRLPSPAQSR